MNLSYFANLTLFLFMVMIVTSCKTLGLSLAEIGALEDPTSSEEVSGASALVSHAGFIYVIRDNANSIYQYDSNFLFVAKVPIFPGELPEDQEARKKAKPDLEAATLLPSSKTNQKYILLVPSGSKENRHKGALMTVDHRGVIQGSVRHLDFSALFSVLKSSLVKLNIEGVIYREGELIFFHRGNSRNARNAMIFVDFHFNEDRLDAIDFSKGSVKRIVYPELGKSSKGVAYTFTDAILYSPTSLLFLAAAEETDDAFLDGGMSGVILGRMDFEGRVLESETLSKSLKLEGLVPVPFKAGKPGQKMRLYLASDADDDQKSAQIYSYLMPWRHE